MASPHNVNVDQVRQILTEVIDSLDSPDYSSKLDEAKEAAGNEMLKMMQIVFPMVVQIEMEIIKRYGFSNSREVAVEKVPSPQMRGVTRFHPILIMCGLYFEKPATIQVLYSSRSWSVKWRVLMERWRACTPRSAATSYRRCLSVPRWIHLSRRKIYGNGEIAHHTNMPHKRKKYKLLMCALLVIGVCYFFGISDYIVAKSYENEFDYPLNVDIVPIVDEVLSGMKPSVSPINHYPYRFLSNSGTCNTIEKLDLFIVVKSAMQNFGHRTAIRLTYGQEDLIPGRIIKMLFFLGIDNGSPKTQLQKQIDEEMIKYKDIIQMDFHDNYYNNTIKTMMSFRWLYEHCSTADYYLFTDDDMYISVNNLLDHIHDKIVPMKEKRDEEKHVYTGYMFRSSPLRLRTSKWRVSLEEYPWDKWPPYITAGAYLVSNKSMRALYVGSLFVKHFRFDDIYLGIVAKKVGITPEHCPKFHFYKKHYDKEGYRDVIASHGYDDHEEMIRVWNEQNDAKMKD